VPIEKKDVEEQTVFSEKGHKKGIDDGLLERISEQASSGASSNRPFVS
jgi:hypothetical protein